MVLRDAGDLPLENLNPPDPDNAEAVKAHSDMIAERDAASKSQYGLAHFVTEKTYVEYEQPFVAEVYRDLRTTAEVHANVTRANLAEAWGVSKWLKVFARAELIREVCVGAFPDFYYLSIYLS